MGPVISLRIQDWENPKIVERKLRGKFQPEDGGEATKVRFQEEGISR